MIPNAYREPLERFFNFIFFDNDWIEVRVINGGAPTRNFFKGPDTAVRSLMGGNFRSNVYFGVMPRNTAVSGTRADVVPMGNILWADLDMKDGATFNDLLDSMLPDPCIIVGTGHGWHAYWKLRDHIPLNEIERLNKNIASTLGSDNVGDAARILRVPYTVNKKPGLPEVRSDIIRMDNDCPGHFYTAFSIPGDKTTIARAKKARKIMPMEPGHKSRSEVLFAIAISYALRGGSNLEDLEEIMRSVPEGEKLDEMSPTRRAQWINLTFKNAKKSILRR